MQVLEDGKLQSHLRYLRMATTKVFLKPRYSIPIYLYGISIGFVAAGFYTAFDYIPVIKDNQWLLNIIMATSGLMLLGRTFWLLVLRLLLGKFGLSERLKPPTHKEYQLREHLTPNHSPSNILEWILMPLKLFLYIVLYFAAHAEGELIRHIDKHTRQK